MLRRIGMRAHDYGQFSMAELFEKMTVDGYKTTQLALKKAIKGVTSIEEGLKDQVIHDIAEAVKASDCDISVFGAYLNYAHPDEAEREKNVDLFCRHLAYMNTIGARVVGTETGSLDPKYKAHRENHGDQAFYRLQKSIETCLKQAEEVDGLVAIEAVAHHIIHTPQRMKRMVDDMAHDRLKVIFDPVNIITADNYMDQDRLISDMFELLEDKILVVHGKDFVIDGGQVKVVPPGTGKLNYDLLAACMKASSQDIDLLAENIPKEALKDVHVFMKQFF